MPTPELASEKALMRIKLSGFVRGDGGCVEERKASHHSRSLCVCFGGVLGLNGESWKIPSMDSRFVRYARAGL